MHSVSVLACGNAQHHLSATVISPFSRVAIINNQLSEIGDVVNGAVVVSIEKEAVLIREGIKKCILYMQADLYTQTRQDIALKLSTVSNNTIKQTQNYGPVKSGESLSLIAKEMRPKGVSISQMTSAIFRQNPNAFNGNINLLHQGVVLKIPSHAQLVKLTQQAASQSIAQQHQQSKKKQNDKVTSHKVRYAQTLSGIAQQFKTTGFTLDQRMMALYMANSHAFKGNINRLKTGVILRMPKQHELMQLSVSSAKTSVIEHQMQWKTPRNKNINLTSTTPAELIESSRSTRNGQLSTSRPIKTI
ncbi:MAG: hypothetical protein HRU20_05060 [Pseudomonadales bacterium]|nr:hypothetical protein [Pseudomonadales bacterium]